MLLVMCTHPVAKRALMLHLARIEGRECYLGCNLMHRKVLASFHQHLMAEAPMTGRQRRDLFISYIAALERHDLKMPRLEPFYREHKYCSVDALYGNRHPPDTVVACALAYHAFRTGRAPGDYGITI